MTIPHKCKCAAPPDTCNSFYKWDQADIIIISDVSGGENSLNIKVKMWINRE